MATASKPESPSAAAEEGLRTWFAVLGGEGYIVAVDPMWRFADERNAPFGPRFPIGASYVDLCASWPQREGPDLAQAVRAVLHGRVNEQSVEYEYPRSTGPGRAEMKVSRFDLAGSHHYLVLHTDLIAEEQRFLHRFQEAKSYVNEQAHALVVHAKNLTEARKNAVDTMRLKAEFMANLSHEIRTPMNGIIGMTDLSLETELMDEQREYMLSVRSSAHALLRVLNNVLDYSNFESSRIKLQEAPFELRDTLAQTLGPLALRAHGKGLELNYELDPDVPDFLIGDSERLSQVLQNLIDNAVKFTDRGEITLRGMLERSEDRKVEVRFDIVDSGVGIEPSLQEQIFGPFFQVDGSTTRSRGGTGLGLTISKQLAELMGGQIEVDSRPGMGSTFSLTVTFEAQGDSVQVDAVDDAVPERPERGTDIHRDVPIPSLEDACRNGLKILVAEDNPVCQRMARSLLERHGNVVEIVENGKQVTKRATTEAWDLILMDIDMPVLDGFGATALIRVREKGTGRHVPILALTGHTMVPDRERFLRAGMDDVLSKPLEAHKLAVVLERLWHRLDRTSAHEREGETTGNKVPPAIDTARLLEYVGGDRSVIEELVEMFVQESSTILTAVTQAIVNDSPRELEFAAHRLKGTFGALAADPACAAARRLESIAHTGDLTQAESVLNELRSQLGQMESELVAIASQGCQEDRE